MATGRIGVTPTLRTRWSKQPTAGTTSLSGLDDNSVSLVYDVGYEAVYRNGTLLSRGNDYTATNGTTVTLIDATLAGDIIEILANQLVPLSDAISKGQFTAKGALLSATAASTPGVLAVGTNGQYLSADSTASTGLAWTTASSGGMTLLSTTTLSGSGVTVSSINQTNKHLYLVLRGVYTAVGGQTLSIRFNGDTGSNYAFVKSSGRSSDGAFACTGSSSTSSPGLADIFASSTYSNMVNMDMTIPRYTASDKKTMFALTNNYDSATLILCQNVVMWNDTSAITSITLNTSGSTFSGGTLYIYGVN